MPGDPKPKPEATAMTAAAAATKMASSSSGSGTPGASVSRLAPGTQLGRYEILMLLGEGGMGAVYKALDRDLDRVVALKVIRPDLVHRPEILLRFKQELLLARAITHRNVVRIYDLGEADGLKFITMEYIQGQDLHSILDERGKLSVAEATEIIGQVLEGLAAAHGNGIIHRDLKPSNIMRDEQGRVVIMDFGLARPLEGDGLTRTDVVLGTMEYMSPEQGLGQTLDSRSDLYTVGLILYQLLSGGGAYQASSPVASLIKRSRERARPLHEIEPTVPVALSQTISKCLEPEQEKRYQSAEELLVELNAFRPGTRSASVLMLPQKRGTRLLPLVIALAAMLVLAVAVAVWLRVHSRPTGEAARQTVSLLIADFANQTNDPAFDGTLEPSFSLAMEGAPFINVYNSGQAHKIAQRIKPGSNAMSSDLARLVAGREGVSSVVSGSIAPRGNGFQISMQLVDAVSGKQIADAEATASDKNSVLHTLGTLAANLRSALGDKTPESAQLLQSETFTSGSIDAAHEYAVAQELQWFGKWEQAIPHYEKAVQLDPDMGRAYAGLAAANANMGRRQDALKFYKLALTHIDRMTDREKYRTRGGYYLMQREPQKAVDEYTALVQQYPGDYAAYGNLALAYFYQRNMAKAMEVGRRAVEAQPKALLDRDNLALYAVYAGDFATAEKEARTVLEQNPSFTLAYNSLGMAQIGQGKLADATSTFKKLRDMGAFGESLSTAGLADIALYEDRLADAESALQEGIDSALKNSDQSTAAAKLALLAQVHAQLGRKPQAAADAQRSVSLDKAANVVFWAAQAHLLTGNTNAVDALVKQLSASLDPDSQLYSKLLAAQSALARRDLSNAISLFEQAQRITDSWLGHYYLGQAYLQAEMFTEASSEFDTCLKRRGEASAIFLDDSPTFHLVPTVYYYLGRAQEGLHSPAAAESYKTYLAARTGPATPMSEDARRRLK